METPRLIQRCELGPGQITYDYMDSSYFEVGDQGKSLRRIFAQGIQIGRTTVNLESGGTSVSTAGGSTTVSFHRQHTDVPVYMVAGKGFIFADYQPYLQQLAEDKLRLAEWTKFHEVIRAQVGHETDRRFVPKTNVWFDFRNDVLWTLSEGNQKNLVAVLEFVKKAWGVD